MKILIADDNPQVRNLLRSLIETNPKWSVCAEATDGLTAVKQTRSSRPDLIILDLVMPRMNGLNAARQISKEFPSIRILLHSLYQSRHIEMEAKKCGVHRLLPKSAGWDILAVIEDMLGPTSSHGEYSGARDEQQEKAPEDARHCD